MDRRKIYDLLCEVINEAELGKTECVKENFEVSRLCDHAWENLENLVSEIGKVITAEDRALVERRVIDFTSEDIDFTDRALHNLPESDDVRGEGDISNA